MERIASHTKQPGELREIFAALGNDSLVIAECLARPVLTEALTITELYAHDQRFHGELKRRAEAELRSHTTVTQMKQTSGMYTEIERIKTDSANDGSAPVDAKSAQAVKMNGSEWQDSLAKHSQRSLAAPNLVRRDLSLLAVARARCNQGERLDIARRLQRKEQPDTDAVAQIRDWYIEPATRGRRALLRRGGNEQGQRPVEAGDDCVAERTVAIVGD